MKAKLTRIHYRKAQSCQAGSLPSGWWKLTLLQPEPNQISERAQGFICFSKLRWPQFWAANVAPNISFIVMGIARGLWSVFCCMVSQIMTYTNMKIIYQIGERWFTFSKKDIPEGQNPPLCNKDIESLQDLGEYRITENVGLCPQVSGKHNKCLL